VLATISAQAYSAAEAATHATRGANAHGQVAKPHTGTV